MSATAHLGCVGLIIGQDHSSRGGVCGRTTLSQSKPPCTLFRDTGSCVRQGCDMTPGPLQFRISVASRESRQDFNLGSFPVSSQRPHGLGTDAGAGTTRLQRHVAGGIWKFELGFEGVDEWPRDHCKVRFSRGMRALMICSSTQGMARAPTISSIRRLEATRISRLSHSSVSRCMIPTEETTSQPQHCATSQVAKGSTPLVDHRRGKDSSPTLGCRSQTL